MPWKVRQHRLVCTCDVCGAVAMWGFGPMWACCTHRSEVEQAWIMVGRPAR